MVATSSSTELHHCGFNGRESKTTLMLQEESLFTMSCRISSPRTASLHETNIVRSSTKRQHFADGEISFKMSFIAISKRIGLITEP